MKTGHKNLLRVVMFGALVLALILGLNIFLQPVWFNWNNYYTTKGFYKEPDNTIETVFVGASIVTNGFTPTELYDEYGMCAYNLGLEQQPMLATYYWTEEAYRLHSETLKNVVFDVSGLRSASPNESFYHKSFDNMQLSDVKIRAVMDYKDVYSNLDSLKDFNGFGKLGTDIIKLKNSIKDTFSFMIPFISYHDRWSDLEPKDFTKYGVDPVNGTRGYAYTPTIYADKVKESEIKQIDTVLDEAAEEQELDEYAMRYFDKLVKFCKEKNLRLILAKTPTSRWSSSLHNRIVSLAKQHELEFVDYNYAPYYDELGYIHTYDTTDGAHLNYYGASKVTKAIGKYLVENCDATDVRGNDKYAYMEAQAEEYKDRIRDKVELNGTTDIASYIESALSDNNAVFITSKGDCAATLTKEQRDYFKSVGLKKLAKIDSYDYYAAVIEDGKVVFEELKKNSSKDVKIVYKGELSDGTQYAVGSYSKDGDRSSSCRINGTQRSKNTRGLNLVVYNLGIGEFINATTFDTTAANHRQAYSLDIADELVNDKKAEEKYSSDTLYGKIIRLQNSTDDQQKANALRLEIGENDVFGFLDAYRKDENKVIVISVRDDASESLTKKDRKAFSKIGLEELSKIGYRDSYIAVIDGGKVTKEVVDHGDDPITVKTNSITVKSSGRESGNVSSIKLDNREYSANLRGLNVAVYDKELKRIVDTNNFDTSKALIDSETK